MKNVELIYDKDCPNVQEARDTLSRALELAELSTEWVEWDRESPASPPHARRYGSPTILVSGRDVSGGGETGDGNCCRVYTDTGDFKGVPAVETIRAALMA